MLWPPASKFGPSSECSYNSRNLEAATFEDQTMPIPTFGLSAFLKIICLNPKPQRRELRERFSPRKGPGYDFHRKMRSLARKIILSPTEFSDTLDQAQMITRAPERASAITALEKIHEWRKHVRGSIIEMGDVTYRSPLSLFQVRYVSDFGIERDGKITPIHIWNTKNPKLMPALVRGALSLFPSEFAKQGIIMHDIAVLSLRDDRLYRLGEVSDAAALGAGIVMYLDNLIQRDISEPNTGIQLPSRPTRRIPPTLG